MGRLDQLELSLKLSKSEEAVEDMLGRTDHEHGRWQLVGGTRSAGRA